MAIHKLTDKQVKTLGQPGRYGDGNNLYLQVSDTGTKSWKVRYSYGGKQRSMGLGSYPSISLAVAREKALEAKGYLADGRDPIIERDKQRNQARREASEALLTFEVCTEEYIRIHSSSWSNSKHRQQWSNTLRTYAYPCFGSLPIKDVTRDDVLAALRPIWHSKTETASRLQGRLAKILSWAKSEGHRSGENPAAWRDNLEHSLPSPSDIKTVNHHKSLPYEELPAFYARLREMETYASFGLQFLILTALRSGEVREATWEEIDFDKRRWTIPAQRMKMKIDHVVPLSDPALELLERMRPLGGPYIFPSHSRPKLSENAFAVPIRALGAEVTAHGFRSTFREWAGNTTDHDRQAVEFALAHKLKDKVEAAYLRGNLLQKRIPLMNDWAAYCVSNQ